MKKTITYTCSVCGEMISCEMSAEISKEDGVNLLLQKVNAHMMDKHLEEAIGTNPEEMQATKDETVAEVTALF